MISDVAQELADNVVENTYNVAPAIVKSTALVQKKASSTDTLTPSAYSMSTERSQSSGDVDRWMNDTQSLSVDSGVQGSNTFTVQRSTLVSPSSLNNNSMWYMLALALPLININNASYTIWRCTPSTLVSTAEIFLTQLSRVCRRAQANIRRLAEEQFARDLFAAAMDVVLVIYAIGFLVISMYQAQVIT